FIKSVCVWRNPKENYQKKILAALMEKTIPNTKIKYVHKDEDPRDYRVDFSKIKNELGFQITKTVPESIRNLYNLLKNNILINPFEKKYRNI
ncbi:MAG TPA: epimerase, partial [Candidatus Cloacimonas sp.]|nr:epimerase [Candidatus Cloacimonas sp.]